MRKRSNQVFGGQNHHRQQAGAGTVRLPDGFGSGSLPPHEKAKGEYLDVSVDFGAGFETASPNKFTGEG